MNEIYFLENYQNISGLMQGVSIALITLLVSFAVSLLVYKLNNNNNLNNLDKSLDLRLSLDYVWKFKQTLFFIFISVFIPLFLSTQNIPVRILIFVLWCISTIWIICTIIRLYTWVKGDKHLFRKEYLKSLLRKDLDVWDNVWSYDKLPDQEESDFVKIFLKQINKLKNKEDIPLLNKIITSFEHNLKKRKWRYLIQSDFFSEIFEIHYFLWEKEDTKNWTGVDLRLALLKFDQIIQEALGHVIRYPRFNSDIFFSHLEKHLEKKEASYISRFPMYYTILNSHNLNGEYFYFPEDWKINSLDLEKNTIHAKIWCKKFIDWFQEKFTNQDVNIHFGSQLQILFPYFEYKTWIYICLLVVIQPRSTEQMLDFIKKSSKLSYFYILSSEVSDHQKITIDFSKQTFNILTVNKDKWIELLHKTEVDSDNLNRNKKFLLDLLNKC